MSDPNDLLLEAAAEIETDIPSDFRAGAKCHGDMTKPRQLSETTVQGKPAFDPAEAARALRLILEPGQVTELRALDAITSADRRPHVASGYFDDIDKLVEAAATIRSAKGIYFIPNVVNPALLARAHNRLRAAGREPTTSDHDIQRRRWLLIDIDSDRPAGISASDEEHEAAIELAFHVRATLHEEGWPSPIVADSGNGAHLLYQIAEPALDGDKVKLCLSGLAARFDDNGLHVDKSVFNPARIVKLYGTVAAKGDCTPERPHRLSRILEGP